MQLTKEIIEAVENSWIARAEGMAYRPKNAAFGAKEVEFFVGAMNAFKAAGYENWHVPRWLLSLQSGRRICKVHEVNPRA